MNHRYFLLLVLLSAPIFAETVDNCASLLGSIAVEHRYARAQPASVRTTFVCPRDTHALIGASKQRLLNALGPPDVSGSGSDWSYSFTGAWGGERAGGYPELSFTFDDRQEVILVRCQVIP
jgi:hypothetical protein